MPAGRNQTGAPQQDAPAALYDTSVPHIARVYNYWLGGKDHFAADRELAEKFIAADPKVIAGVRANRAFLGRAVHFLAAEAASGSSSTSAPASPPRATPTRWRSAPPPTRGSSTSITTRSCSRTPARC
jgi:hypothetical protein